MKCDVLVVGAGPAGSCTAREIAEAGFDVLAIDRREELGFPVQCGEFLPVPDELHRILPRSEDFGDLFDIDASFIERETSAIDIFGPGGVKYEMEFKGVTLDRRRYDKFLWKRAEKTGARLMTGIEFHGLSDPGTANTTVGDIEFEILIGADGPLSRVRRTIGLGELKHISQAITAQASGEWDDRVRMYFGTIAPGGYAWIIPKRSSANIGLGIQKSFSKESLSALLDEFSRKYQLSHDDPAYGNVPISGPIARTCTGNAILVGDAAGQVMATNGGGIPIAMIAGRIAGRIASKKLQGKGSLSEYESEWRRQLGAPLRNAARTKAMADLFFGGDRRLSFSMRLLGSRGLKKAILCKRIFFLF